jgi:hypothetical protein
MYKLELPAVVDKNGSWYLVVASRISVPAEAEKRTCLHVATLQGFNQAGRQASKHV